MRFTLQDPTFPVSCTSFSSTTRRCRSGTYNRTQTSSSDFLPKRKIRLNKEQALSTKGFVHTVKKKKKKKKKKEKKKKKKKKKKTTVVCKRKMFSSS